ncbi:signal peptidase II [Mucilaginibacter myungsuensis]|uniref:Lipoprotein signal peptidase n=1 Tax=Mucilaginibacter myungsuensis TaxID=649104 RepID=A0A929PWA8_9SPHI|nr:signal peptidase II [Mucilaginibacter myungsuensis]MBE9661939.1 signal peptidase II [Mucilaginibacter myungsuensis]MDN3599628.1 signal peptidase II [Mucilaginibacter myungsuensis]
MKSAKTITLIKIAIILLVISVNIGCDQVSKNIVRNNISESQLIGYVGGHFTLMKVENTGAFLSLGNNIPTIFKYILLIGMPILMLLGSVIFLIIKKVPRIPLIGACFVIGGGIGNIYDRILYGSVTDFMHIRFGALQTGVFNMADVSVTVGASMLFIWYFLEDRKAKKFKEAETA